MPNKKILLTLLVIGSYVNIHSNPNREILIKNFLDGSKAQDPIKQKQFLASLRIKTTDPKWKECQKILKSSEQGCRSPQQKRWHLLRQL